MVISSIFSPSVYDCILPRPFVRTIDWAEKSINAPPPMNGKIRFDLFPYMREPVDCIDDPKYNRVTVQAAARTGKTTGVQCAMLRIAAKNPHDMLWSEPDEHSCRRVLKRSWKMAESCQDLAGKIPPRRLQAASHMQFTDCLVHGAWSGSATKVADLAAYLAVVNEADKMQSRKRRDDSGTDVGEAEFVDLVAERVIGFPGATVVELSTPTVHGSSRIEQQRLSGDNRQFYVPCPHCNHFQTLRSGNGREPGGIRWKKGPDGHSNPQITFETAWYECEKCEGKILDEHRYSMMNDGKWVKEGQVINRRGVIRTPKGAKVKSGSHASFGPIGRHYSLLPGVTWGTIGSAYVEAKRDASGRKWRNFLNAVEGVTWDPSPNMVRPHELTERLGTDEPLKICPEWAYFLTLSADVGRVGENLFFFWWIDAWGRGQRGQLVDYGVSGNEDEFADLLKDAVYPIAGSSEKLRPVRIGVDSGEGHVSNRIYDLCKTIPNAWPMKGSSTSGFPDMYQIGFQRSDIAARILARKRKLGIGDLLIINTQRSQERMEDILTGVIKPEDPKRYTIPLDAFTVDPDLPVQLLNEYAIDERSEKGRIICNWIKKGDNEWRDCARMSHILAMHYTQNGQLWETLRRRDDQGQVSRHVKKPKLKNKGSGKRPFIRKMSGR
jgi:phage terminase large subunit GpA-like protein